MKQQFLIIIASIFLISTAANCSDKNANSKENEENAQVETNLEDLEVAYFASGCFWCVEAVFESVKGVEEAVSGYSGGTTPNPTYQKVSYGLTDHAEAVAVYYDPKVVSFKTLVKVFFGSQDPTTLNRQGPDRGTQYRSIAFYQNDNEKKIIENYIEELTKKKVFADPIVTEVKAFTKFYQAEDYHQNYEKLNPNESYVQSVSIPRLNRFKAKFPELLKNGD